MRLFIWDILRRFVFVFILTLLAGSSKAQLPDIEPHSASSKDYVLFISTINFHQEWSKDLYWFVYNNLRHKGLSLKAESLSVPTLKDLADIQQLHKRLASKYSSPPKTIIIIGEPGWIVCRPLFDAIWKDVPVIITNSQTRVPASLDILLSHADLTPENSVPSEVWKKGYNVTSLKQPIFVKETVDLMKQLLPKMNKVALISDDRYASSIVRSELTNTIQTQYPELTIENLCNIPTEEMVEKLHSYNAHTGVIYYSWFEKQDGSYGTYLVDYMQNIINSLTSTPIFILTDHNMQKNHFAGGHYISMYAFGEKLVQTLDFILDGIPAHDIPTGQGGKDSTFLNYAQLQNCKIPSALYPQDVKYFNPPLSFYEQYKIQLHFVISTIITIFFIIGFYIYTLHNKHQQQEKENNILKEQEELQHFYESILNQLPVALTIKSVKNNYKFSFWNQQACKSLGYSQEEAIDSNYDFFQDRTFAHNLQCIDHELALTGGQYSTVIKHLNQKNEIRYSKIMKAVIPYKEDDPQIISTSIDVSDIYLSKQHLETLNQKYELTLKTAGVRPWEMDLETHKVEIAKDGEYDAQEIFNLIHPDDVDHIKQQYYNLEMGKVTEIHHQYRIADSPDSQVYKWISTSAIIGKYNSKEEPAVILGASTDITSYKELELQLRATKEEAEKANRLKSLFISNLNNEIRTPLNSIAGFSELLAEAEDTEEKQSYLKIISENNEQLLQLINTIVEVTHIETGKLDLSYDNTDFQEIVNEAIKTSVPKKMPEGVTLCIEPSQDPCILSTDKAHVIQVLGDLITNAIRHTPQGAVTIGYRMKNEHTLYAYVRDTGCGLSEERQKSLFERRYKLESLAQGHGIGLPICKMIIKELGGTIGVTSQEGQGSEFWFTLPV